MDGSLAVRCRYSGKGFMFSIHQRMNYAYLFEYICERFRLSATDVIELHYSLPGCPLSFLQNDNDFQMMFIGAKIYNLDCVEIIVEKNSEGCSKRTSVSCEDSCSEVLDEDDYLTEGYRFEVSKPYLSREWGSYIQCLGRSFVVVPPNFEISCPNMQLKLASPLSTPEMIGIEFMRYAATWEPKIVNGMLLVIPNL